MQEIAADPIAPSAAQVLGALDSDQLEDVLGLAVALRDAAQAIIAGDGLTLVADRGA